VYIRLDTLRLFWAAVATEKQRQNVQTLTDNKLKELAKLVIVPNKAYDWIKAIEQTIINTKWNKDLGWFGGETVAITRNGKTETHKVSSTQQKILDAINQNRLLLAWEKIKSDPTCEQRAAYEQLKDKLVVAYDALPIPDKNLSVWLKDELKPKSWEHIAKKIVAITHNSIEKEQKKGFFGQFFSPRSANMSKYYSDVHASAVAFAFAKTMQGQSIEEDTNKTGQVTLTERSAFVA